MTLDKQAPIPDTLVANRFGECEVRPLQIAVNRMFGRVYMVLSDELDDSTAPLLRQKLEDEILPDLGDEVVLDIGLVSFINSAGLNLLLSLHKDLTMQGSKLVYLFAHNFGATSFRHHSVERGSRDRGVTLTRTSSRRTGSLQPMS